MTAKYIEQSVNSDMTVTLIALVCVRVGNYIRPVASPGFVARRGKD